MFPFEHHQLELEDGADLMDYDIPYQSGDESELELELELDFDQVVPLLPAIDDDATVSTLTPVHETMSEAKKARRQKVMVPESKKDSKYLTRRKQNTVAARRSRIKAKMIRDLKAACKEALEREKLAKDLSPSLVAMIAQLE